MCQVLVLQIQCRWYVLLCQSVSLFCMCYMLGMCWKLKCCRLFRYISTWVWQKLRYSMYILRTNTVFCMVLPQLPQLVLYHFFISPFCTSKSIKITNCLLDGFSNDRPVQILENNCLCSINSYIKDIHIILIQ